MANDDNDMKYTPAPQSHLVGYNWIDCPCTTFEQDEDCPVGYPSLLCSACDGKGVAALEDVVALAAEMMKVAEQVDELEDPLAAWESIELLKSQAAKSYPVKMLQWTDINWDIKNSCNTPFAWDSVAAMNVDRYRVRWIGGSYTLFVNGINKGSYPTAAAAKAAAQADHEQCQPPAPQPREDV